MCNMNGQMYDLLQYHFHTPSEHALDGKRFSMEVHLVHKNRDTGEEDRAGGQKIETNISAKLIYPNIIRPPS